MIQVGDVYEVTAQSGKRKGLTRMYTVTEVAPGGLDAHCTVDPPMASGSDKAFVSVAHLLRNGVKQ